ncbi:MAG: lysophospholipid acyltransferase family protein [Anaerolineales bacterium]
MNTSQKQTIAQTLAQTVLRLIGWKMDTRFPDTPKYLLIVAHHTSNWDLPLGLLFTIAAGVKVHWIGKDGVFRWPFGGFMRWLGGIPVNRRVRSNFVDQIAQAFEQSDELVITITPEGTRSKTEYWKSGFYYIGQEANVPIALGYLDYSSKTVGSGGWMMLTGDMEADLVAIREFYASKKGKFPNQHGEIRFRPRSNP